MTSAQLPVIAEQVGKLGRITLNRPDAINALTHEMIRIIAAALERWRFDTSVETVAIIGSGARGLCAGGDVVALYHDATSGDGSGSREFWADEYAVNNVIAHYPKPFVAVQDGIVLGGGVGISAHGSHRIVTERTRIGFPEVSIGYVPDVGASWLLSRSPGQLGTRAALTGESFGAADAILLGLADTYVASRHLDALMVALESESADSAIGCFASEAPRGALADSREWVDDAFSSDSVTEILRRLREIGTAPATAVADTIQKKSPIALAVALAGLRQAATFRSVTDAFRTEFRVSAHALTTRDFREGIRAQVIDKDRNPQWRPKAHEDVTAASIEAYFAAHIDGDWEPSENVTTGRTA